MGELTPVEKVATAYSSKNGKEAMEVLNNLTDEELRDLHRVLGGIQGSIESILDDDSL